MITRLKLTNFRQFNDFEINFKGTKIAILLAQNTKGKSTLLEAIHYITNLHSPFTSRSEDLIKRDSTDQHFRIEVDELHQGKQSTLAIFSNEKTKKYFLDNHSTTRKKFNPDLRAVIFSPEQIEQLMSSPDNRRTYLDMLISQIEPDYNEKIVRMKKILRQRNAYLKRLAKTFYDTGYINEEDSQLNYWSEQLAEVSAMIMKDRATYIAQLYNENFYIEYATSLPTELDLATTSIDIIIAEHINYVSQNIRRDIASGVTNTGAHRDDWSIHTEKNIHRYGSRGEKRMAIGRMILKAQDIIAQHLGRYPILLLDDISSELDDSNIEKIVAESIRDEKQIIITTIRLDGFPKSVIKEAEIINL